MARRFLRPFGFWCSLLLLLRVTATADASVIRLKSGDTYPDATVIRRTATTVEIQVRYGTLTLPLDIVDRIDGVPVSPVTPPPAAPIPRLPFVAPAAPATPAVPASAPKPGPVSAAAVHPAPSPAAPEWRSFLPDWQRWNIMQFGPVLWIVLGALAVLWLWAETLPRVGAGLREDRSMSRAWYVAALLLPGVGYLLYLGGRRLGQRIESRRAEAADGDHFEFLDADQQPIHIESSSEVFSGIQNARGVIESALHKRASDVHIEPLAQEYRIRVRVDGSMLTERAFSTNEGVRLVSALKTLANLNAAERRKAQDGRFGARQGGRGVDFRVATAPSMHGEMLVLRILDRKAGVRGLNDLGMPQGMMDRFAEVIRSRNGMILATGPTGSGKTSTLYAALGQLDANQLKLLTIEDPVEYELAGATQIPVNARAGVTYESGLRSILRLDPDVILVGEMRDLESAQIALRAALTGHLVFSSLHTRDAIGAVMRLEEMGIEPHLVASALFVVLSQRLVRTLCDACREPYECVGGEMAELGIELNPGETLYRAVGCRRCEGTGYLGRTGIFEMLVLDKEIRQSVNGGIEEDDLFKLARTKGFASYREDGALKVLLGVTTVDEVIQAN